MNRHRVYAIRSAEVMRGISSSFVPDNCVADAIAEIPEQIDEVMRTWRANVEEQKLTRNRG